MATKIEWADETWNPVTGCSKVSDGCKNCYAERLSHRFGWTDKPWTVGNAVENVRLHQERLDKPLKWKKPRRIFVNSMSDLFHEDVPYEFIDQVFDTMVAAKQHTFQVLTKRPVRMKQYMERFMARRKRFVEEFYSKPEDAEVRRMGREWAEKPPANVWLGVSVESQQAAEERIPLLLQTPAALRFLSMEPLLGPVDLGKQLGWAAESRSVLNGWHGIDWVIVGGESGPKARPMHPDWVRNLRDQCQEAGVPFYMKQMGSAWNKKGKGNNLSEIPEDLRMLVLPSYQWLAKCTKVYGRYF